MNKPQNTDTLQPHPGVCSICNSDFVITKRAQLVAQRKGKNTYCSQECRTIATNEQQKKRYRTTGHLLGPCPTCGQMFRSQYKEKQYCSMPCYTGHPSTIARLRNMNPNPRMPNSCANCGKSISIQYKYCGKQCRREYFAARFDRFIANPEKIALPQNFDEFLLQDELPCLVEGCEWLGVGLGYHVNVTHGITAERFRELVGFNRSTGLLGAAAKKLRAAHTKQLVADGILVSGFDIRDVDRSRRESPRLEASEHMRKAQAIAKATHPPRPPIPCRQCGAPAEQPLQGKRLYCSTRCRSRYYQESRGADLRCAYCGITFWGTLSQVNRARRELLVCCSLDCRNSMNMAVCLANRAAKSRQQN